MCTPAKHVGVWNAGLSAAVCLQVTVGAQETGTQCLWQQRVLGDDQSVNAHCTSMSAHQPPLWSCEIHNATLALGSGRRWQLLVRS